MYVAAKKVISMVKQEDGRRLPDEMWEQMTPLLPPRKFHPLGDHNPRVPSRVVMNALKEVDWLWMEAKAGLSAACTLGAWHSFRCHY
jgi:hypothetical protein